MAIPASEKSPLALWIVSVRKRLDGNNVASFAARLGVSEDTVRGWEARSKPGPDNIRKIERLADESAPTDGNQPGFGDLLRVIAAQTEAIRSLVEEIHAMRKDQTDLMAFGFVRGRDAGREEGRAVERRHATPPAEVGEREAQQRERQPDRPR